MLYKQFNQVPLYQSTAAAARTCSGSKFVFPTPFWIGPQIFCQYFEVNPLQRPSLEHSDTLKTSVSIPNSNQQIRVPGIENEISRRIGGSYKI